jgi:hypothetical protein
MKKGTGFDPDQVAEAWYNLYKKRTEAEDNHFVICMKIR